MAVTYEPIASTTLGSAQATITFSSIAASWTDLRLVFNGVGSGASASVRFRFNSDSTTIYSTTYIQGDGSSATSGRYATNDGLYGSLTNMSTTLPTFVTMDILSYTGSTYKTALITKSDDANGSGTVMRFVGLWRSGAAITSITIFNNASNNYAIGTTATLYGIKAA